MTKKSSLETRSLVPGKSEFEVLKVRVSRQETPRGLKARNGQLKAALIVGK
jgi:hypothetical protein